MDKQSSSSSNSHSIFFTDELEKYMDCNFIKIESIRHRIHKKGLRLSRKSVKLLKVFFNRQIESYLEKIHIILMKNTHLMIGFVAMFIHTIVRQDINHKVRTTIKRSHYLNFGHVVFFLPTYIVRLSKD